jgi:hypothetical protein
MQDTRNYYTQGLSHLAQKTLLQQIERRGGIDKYRNKQNEKEQLLKPVLDKFPSLFGPRGDSRRRQATDTVKYWYNHFYRESRYNELLFSLDIPCSLDSSNIRPTPPTHTKRPAKFTSNTL